MSDQYTAEQIVEKMLDNDAFSKWLGIELIAVEPGSCQLAMTVRPEMTNGFGMAHGGITFSFADSALAFAANGHGQQAVSILTSVAHHLPVNVGDALFADAQEVSRSRKVAFYQVSIQNQSGELVASFQGTVNRSSREWEIDD